VHRPRRNDAASKPSWLAASADDAYDSEQEPSPVKAPSPARGEGERASPSPARGEGETRVVSPASEASSSPPKPKPPPPSLDAMSIKELRRVSVELGVDVSRCAEKADLVEAVGAAAARKAAPALSPARDEAPPYAEPPTPDDLQEEPLVRAHARRH
jgi:hypothetical protein